MFSGGTSKRLYERWRERQVFCSKQLKLENSNSNRHFKNDSKFNDNFYINLVVWVWPMNEELDVMSGDTHKPMVNYSQFTDWNGTWRGWDAPPERLVLPSWRFRPTVMPDSNSHNEHLVRCRLLPHIHRGRAAGSFRGTGKGAQGVRSPPATGGRAVAATASETHEVILCEMCIS